jgi:hypothetical protein
VQVVEPQEVPLGYSLQAAELPEHMPFWPQEFAPWSVHSFCGSRLPTMKPQAPSAPAPLSASVHAWQMPLQAPSQQTLSTQKELLHWDPKVHELPLGWSARQVPVGISQ